MTLFDLPYPFMVTCVFILGATIGSFLNVCIYRIPRHENWLKSLQGLTYPPSSCPRCGRRILAIDNIPIFGWLFLRGRCRFCKTKISIRYPAIEFLNGLLFVTVYWAFVPTGWAPPVADSQLWTPLGGLQQEGAWGRTSFQLHIHYLYFMVLVEALLVATFIDFDLQIIPDGVTVPAAIVGVLGAAISGKLFLLPVWFQDPQFLQDLVVLMPGWEWMLQGPAVPGWVKTHPHLHGLATSLAGFVVGGGMVWIVRILGSWVFRQEAMGFGDVILMAMIGSFIGWQATILVFFLAPVCALVVVAATFMFVRDRVIPYGPYLSLATLLLLLFWQPIFARTERIFSMGPMLPVLGLLMLVFLVVSLVLVQGVKRLLGIKPPEYPEESEWTSADQLAFFANRSPEVVNSNWPAGGGAWPGERASQGRGSYHRWKSPR